MSKIVINLGNGMNLVAEQNSDYSFKNEIFIGIVDDNGAWSQDLAVVRNSYSIDSDMNVVWKDGVFDILVYADKDDEDYTDSFEVELSR